MPFTISNNVNLIPRKWHLTSYSAFWIILENILVIYFRAGKFTHLALHCIYLSALTEAWKGARVSAANASNLTQPLCHIFRTRVRKEGREKYFRNSTISQVDTHPAVTLWRGACSRGEEWRPTCPSAAQTPSLRREGMKTYRCTAVCLREKPGQFRQRNRSSGQRADRQRGKSL